MLISGTQIDFRIWSGFAPSGASDRPRRAFGGLGLGPVGLGDRLKQSGARRTRASGREQS